MRSLRVYVDREPVGTLHEGNDLWRFEYSEAWSSVPEGAPNAYDLSPALPRIRREHVDGSTLRPVQWFFDNLLPEEMLRAAVSREAGIKGEDAFALLEYLGAESAGSLTLLPPGRELAGGQSLRPLGDADLSRRIALLPRQTLASHAPKRMSLAGAQHKLLVVLQEGRLYEPVGAAPSTHILKPEHPDTETYPASVINEYLTMRLARAVRLPVPNVHIRYVPDPVYIVERFDREVRVAGTEPDDVPSLSVQRKHIVDACQLLNRARVFKHSGATLEALGEIIDRTTNKLHTRLTLFRWLVFNLAIGNDDCHLKNLSFFIANDGVKLAPHYDLLATCVWHTRAFADHKATWDEVPLAIPLPGASVFAQVTHESLMKAGEALGVPGAAATRIVREVLDRLPGALQSEKQAMAERHARLPAEARVHLAAETRLARVLESIVLEDMLRRMSR